MFVVSANLLSRALILAFACLVPLSHAQKLPRPVESTNQPPKAARSVHLVYDAVQADMYYSEMRIDETTDNSFFTPCAWENGYFGLQQFDGEDKRALNFAVWNPEDPETGVKASEDPVEVVYSHPRVVITRLTGKGGGMQCMRQTNWKVGETNRFVVQAQVDGNKTAYTAWLYDVVTGRWERLATFRAVTQGRWMRGYFSFIEDFRRDFKSAQETRRARFPNVWVHQDQGSWVSIRQAMFTISSLRNENRDAVDAGEIEGSFTLATGGAVEKKQKIGRAFRLSEAPFKKPEPPDLWFLYERPKL